MNKNYYDELLDSKIKVAGHEMLQKLADEAPCDEDLAATAIKSDDLDKKIEDSINSEVRKLRAKRALKISARIAAALLVLIGISAITISSTEALRVKFLNLLITSNEESMTIRAVENGMPEDAVNPAYLPEGYVFSDAIGSGGDFAVSFYDDAIGGSIRIERLSLGGSISLDNEDTLIYEIDIAGKKAIVMETKADNFLIYYGDFYCYSIAGNVEVTELILIAKGLPKQK